MSSTATQKNNNATPRDPDILVLVKNEHKYTLMLLSVLREQLAEFDIGKTPDYQLMYDTIRYINDFPEKFNHPNKHALIQAIIDKAPENNEVLESLLAEKRQINPRCKEVIRALKGLLKEESILKEEQLKIFCKNFVELLESHIEIESQLLFTKARTELSNEDLNLFDVKFIDDEDQALSNIIEERYKELSKVLNTRWDEIEEAANDFALAEFIGMSALFESIEPLSIGIGEISKIIKEFSYKAYIENYNCYKSLFSKDSTGSDYIEKPTACFRTCYKEYVASLAKISDVVKNTKNQITEPYSSSKEFYNETIKESHKKTKAPKSNNK
jgi:hemerythrin-like domain-containing protein